MDKKHLAAAEQIIFNELDVKVEWGGEVNPLECEGWLKSVKHPISTSRIGIMAIAIKSLTVQVFAGFDRETDTLYLTYDLRYEHTQGGSNGYEVRRQFKL